MKFNKLGLLKNRDIFYLLSGQLISNLGTSISGVAIIWYIMEVQSKSKAAIFVGVFWILKLITEICAGPISGVLVDKLDRKKILIGTDIIRGFFAVALTICLYYDINSFILIFAYYFFNFLFGSFFNSAVSTVVPNVVSEDKLAQTNALVEIILQSSWLIGAALSGFIYSKVPIFIIFAIDGSSYFISAAYEYMINIPKNNKASKDSFLRNFVDGFNYLKNRKVLLKLMSIQFYLSFFLASSVRIVMPLFIKFSLKLTSREFGVMDTMLPIGNIVGANMNYKNCSEKEIFKKITFPIIALGGCFIFIGISAFDIFKRFFGIYIIYIFICIFVVLAGMFIISITIPINTVYQQIVDDEYRGRFYGFYNSFYRVSMPLGFVFFSQVSTIWSSTYLYLFIGSSILLLGLCMHIKMNFNRLPRGILIENENI